MNIFANASDQVWLTAFTATAVISLVPNVILFAIPTSILTKGINRKIRFQHILLCFAAGALLGTPLLEVIILLLMNTSLCNLEQVS
jgi:hypothetical protein